MCLKQHSFLYFYSLEVASVGIGGSFLVLALCSILYNLMTLGTLKDETTFGKWTVFSVRGD